MDHPDLDAPIDPGAAVWRQGLVAEVRALAARGLQAGRRREGGAGCQTGSLAYLAENSPRSRRAETVRATRRFARRQRTWFRRDPRPVWLDASREDLVEAALAVIRRADATLATAGKARRHRRRGRPRPSEGRPPEVGNRRRSGRVKTPAGRRPRVTRDRGEHGAVVAAEPGARQAENDFVILPGPAGELVLTPKLVAGLCDRRFGIGGDGVLRWCVPRAAGEPLPAAEGAEWFMDYRNADGSLAEICGNGARVFAPTWWRPGWWRRPA